MSSGEASLFYQQIFHISSKPLHQSKCNECTNLLVVQMKLFYSIAKNFLCTSNPAEYYSILFILDQQNHAKQV